MRRSDSLDGLRRLIRIQSRSEQMTRFKTIPSPSPSCARVASSPLRRCVLSACYWKPQNLITCDDGCHIVGPASAEGQVHQASASVVGVGAMLKDLPSRPAHKLNRAGRSEQGPTDPKPTTDPPTNSRITNTRAEVSLTMLIHPLRQIHASDQRSCGDRSERVGGSGFRSSTCSWLRGPAVPESKCRARPLLRSQC